MAKNWQSAIQQAMQVMNTHVGKPIVGAIRNARDQAYQNYWSKRPHEMISPLASPAPNPTDQRMESQGYKKIGEGEYSRVDPKTGFTSKIRFGSPKPQPNQVANVEAPQMGGMPAATPTPFTQNGQMYGRNPSTKIASPEVLNAVKAAEQKYGVPSALLLDIAMQESTLNPNVVNPEPGVTAAGLFQFNDGTWDTVQKYANMQNSSLRGVLPNTNRMDPRTAALAAAYLIKNGQLGRWDASKNIWGKFWPQQELDAQGYYSQTLR